MAKLTLVNPNVEQGSRGERRSFPRLPALSIKTRGEEEFTIEDFSPGGVGIISKKRLDVRQLIEFSINLPGDSERRNLTCQVVWAKLDPKTEEFVAGARFLFASVHEVSLIKYIYSTIREREYSPKVSLTPLTLLSDPELGSRIIEKIQQAELPPFFQELVDRSRAFSKRPVYTWKWCHEAMKVMRLSCADPSYDTLLANTKLTGFMLSILLDDLADEQRESAVLTESLNMIFLRRRMDVSKIPDSEKPHGEFLDQIWGVIQNNAMQFPRYQEFENLLQFDFEQIINTLRYAHLSNQMTRVINDQEATLYEGNNINVMIDAMMDIMCSLSFDVSEVGKLREVVWHAQMMCKIANWLATWKREISVGDWTSGIISSAIRSKVIAYEDLSKNNQSSIIEKIRKSTLEEDLMEKWEQHRSWIVRNSDQVRSVDLHAYLRSLEEFYQMQLVSKGLQ